MVVILFDNFWIVILVGKKEIIGFLFLEFLVSGGDKFDFIGRSLRVGDGMYVMEKGKVF